MHPYLFIRSRANEAQLDARWAEDAEAASTCESLILLFVPSHDRRQVGWFVFSRSLDCASADVTALPSGMVMCGVLECFEWPASDRIVRCMITKEQATAAPQ